MQTKYAQTLHDGDVHCVCMHYAVTWTAAARANVLRAASTLHDAAHALYAASTLHNAAQVQSSCLCSPGDDGIPVQGTGPHTMGQRSEGSVHEAEAVRATAPCGGAQVEPLRHSSGPIYAIRWAITTYTSTLAACMHRLRCSSMASKSRSHPFCSSAAACTLVNTQCMTTPACQECQMLGTIHIVDLLALTDNLRLQGVCSKG